MKTIKNNNALTLIFLGLISIVLFKCEMEKKESEENRYAEEWKEDKNQVKKDIQSLIDEVDDEITVIEENLEEVSEDARTEWKDQLEDLKNTKSHLSEKLSQVEDQTADQWISFKKDVQKGVEEVKLTLEKVGKEIEETFES